MTTLETKSELMPNDATREAWERMCSDGRKEADPAKRAQNVEYGLGYVHALRDAGHISSSDVPELRDETFRWGGALKNART